MQTTLQHGLVAPNLLIYRVRGELPNQQGLNEIFEYRDGMIFYKKPPAYHMKAGDRAGSLHKQSGRRVVSINNISYKEHRIIWMMHHGAIPKGIEIDHIDNNPLNNSIDNLRLATRSQNQMNARSDGKSFSGLKGVNFNKRTNKYFSVITIDRKRVYLGSFSTKEEAFERYKDEANRHHGQFAKY